MNKIKALVMDVDGTLTDGTLNIAGNGELFKAFYCRDGLAILEMSKNGLIPIILTSRHSEIVETRAKELGIACVYQDARLKKDEILKQIFQKHNLSKESTAYIGDDRNDIEAMKMCGFVGCPSDAVKSVKEIADYTCSLPGGKGAVREFIDYILENMESRGTSYADNTE